MTTTSAATAPNMVVANESCSSELFSNGNRWHDSRKPEN
jgi:hypothetical protein